MTLDKPIKIIGAVIGMLTVIFAAAGIVWAASELASSKVDMTEFRVIERRVDVLDTIVKEVRDDIKDIKQNQRRALQLLDDDN